MKLNDVVINDEKLKNRFGFIKISLPMSLFDIESLKALYKVVVPIRSITYDRCYDAYDRMVCYSEQFREIDPGVVLPEYKVTFKRNEDNTVEVAELKEINR